MTVKSSKLNFKLRLTISNKVREIGREHIVVRTLACSLFGEASEVEVLVSAGS